MDLTQLANLGEFIGGIAVLATLIYLALQVRQVRTMATVAAADKNSDLWFNVCNSVLEHYELWCRGSLDKGLSDRENLQFGFLMSEILSYIENFHTKYEQQVIDQDEWDRQQNVLRFYLQWPGTQSYWARSNNIFRPSFRRVVDDNLAGLASGAIQGPGSSLSETVSPPAGSALSARE